MIDVFAIVADLARRQGLEPSRLSMIELNRSGARETAVALLVFRDGAGEPCAFVKATSDAARAEDLRREFENLTRLARQGDEAFLRSVPRPLYCEQLGRLTVLAESATPGVRMKDFPPDRYFRSPDFREHFRLAVDWLQRLHETLGRDPRDDAAGAVVREIELYRSTHDVSAALAALLDETTESLAEGQIPRVPTHGDFCTANIVISPVGDLAVLDWEYPLEGHWPLADLLYFVASTWCVPYRKGRRALTENFARLFFSVHGFSELITESVARHADALGIPRERLLPLSALAWASYANRKRSELDRARAAGAEIDPDAHMPLTLVDGARCLNLEILAERRDGYLPGSP